MSIISTLTRPADVAAPRRTARQGRLTVHWATVVSLAAVMAYADGFWMTSLRGAVGAIERTQGPFGNWWRESTLVLPVFVFAVLGALTLALRLFGPVLRGPRAILATALLVVVAGTVAGIAEIAVSSAYDYHLQTNQLHLMAAMRGACTGSCLAEQQHATLAVHVRAVLYVSRLLLITNLVLVGWVVAMWGGRIHVSRTRRRQGGATAAYGFGGSRVRDVRLLLVVGLLGSAAIHVAVVPQHLTEWAAAGAFFVLLTAGQIAVAGLLLVRPRRVVLLAAVAVSVVPLVLWVYSRTVGMPFGPDPGVPEAVGLPDCLASALEVGTLLAAVALLRIPVWLRRAPVSSHLPALAAVAVVAATAIGLVGTGLVWGDVFAGSQPAMSMTQTQSR